MKRGIWHQMGDKSQKLVVEQIENGAGVGVVVSPRDLALENASEYTATYKKLGAEVIADQQFYNPNYSNAKIESYPLHEYRTSLSKLANLNRNDFSSIISGLISINGSLGTTAVIAPAVVYEASRRDISELNLKLFSCAKEASKELGIPCYATVFLGSSGTASDHTMMSMLSDATALDADGWYFGYEFPQLERIPSKSEDVFRCGVAALTLACTGKPVLHAFAGPMSILSPAFASSAAGIGHYQNMWQFSPTRWEPPTGQGGGGGDAPPRFFSPELWGTIVYPDEIRSLPQTIQNQVRTETPFSRSTRSFQKWTRWDANKHFIYSISSSVQPMFNVSNPLIAAQMASERLLQAIEVHNSIRAKGIRLHDNTDVYQANWNEALQKLINEHGEDYEYIAALTA